MEKKNNSNGKNKGAHAADNGKFNFHRFITFALIILFVLLTFLFFMMPYMSFKEPSSSKDTINENTSLADLKKFENVDYLTSKDFKIDVQNGVSKFGASIFNSSQDIVKNIKCHYTLLDASNNVVYEFDISISRIKPESNSAFSSILDYDLSSVTHYTVSLNK